MKSSSRSKYDAIVIGTGPGGSTVARELSLKGKRVLMVEKGGMPNVRGTGMQTLPTMRQRPTTDKAPVVWQETTGGATFSYCGCALDPPYDMFESRGVHIREEVAEAKKEITINPLSDYLIGPKAKLIAEAAHDCGFEWEKIPKFIDQANCQPNCHLCWYNCPKGAKWTARHFAEEALENRATIINNATVRKVLIDSQNRVEGIMFTHKGKASVAYAPIVIVSAGGIGTPMLLRRTGIPEAGYDFFYDPLILVIGVVKGAILGKSEIPMACGFDDHDAGYLITDMATPPPLQNLYAMSEFKLGSMFKSSSTLAIMIKIRDSLSGEIPAKGKIVKNLGEQEQQSFRAGIEKAKKILKRAGVEKTFTTAPSGAHPGGSAKIGDIVDKNLETKYGNLFVCDASVIPEAFGYPPVLTLIGLGKRLAKHLT